MLLFDRFPSLYVRGIGFMSVLGCLVVPGARPAGGVVAAGVVEQRVMQIGVGQVAADAGFHPVQQPPIQSSAANWSSSACWRATRSLTKRSCSAPMSCCLERKYR
nr:hypothetical protein [Kibdelosporangium sp. MJ126-NF4]CTQ91161.1 hypothetical protein [Kibdelosporangium sp. MJ126-NF4]